MGCDIHLFVEMRQDNQWQTVYGEAIDQYTNDPIGEGGWFWGRNYGLFATLANVRNWDDQFMPISPPRGLPEDISPDAAASNDEWREDHHSHSWLLLSELEPTRGFGIEWETALDRMHREAQIRGLSADDVRIVFWFDN